MALAPRHMTAEEFLDLPFDPALQLIDGEVVRNQPGLRHQRIAGEIFRLIANWLEAHPGSGEVGIPVDVLVDEHNVLTPDLWYVAERNRPARDAGWIESPPELVAEVRSPSTWRYDTGVKREAYLRIGAQELWLVDTEADTVLVVRGDESFEVRPGGLAIDAATLFDR